MNSFAHQGVVFLSFVATLVAAAPVAAQTPSEGRAAGVSAAAQSPDARRVAETIRAVFAAAERMDLGALDTLYAGDSLTVFESAGINRGWRDYRDHHLAPELRAFKNFRYRPFEVEARVSGDLAWAVFRYALSADMAERKVDAVGRGTMILERRGSGWVVRHSHTASRARRPGDPPMP
ncbi:MAG: nuclear transport factor 2 family protein [Gemmatimonadaceae bacterium]